MPGFSMHPRFMWVYLSLSGFWKPGLSMPGFSSAPIVLKCHHGMGFLIIILLIFRCDSVFFVLKKKFGHLSFLHVLHHGIMPFETWWGVRFKSTILVIMIMVVIIIITIIIMIMALLQICWRRSWRFCCFLQCWGSHGVVFIIIITSSSSSHYISVWRVWNLGTKSKKN